MQQWLTDSLSLCEIVNQIMTVLALLTDAEKMCCLNTSALFHSEGNRFLTNMELSSFGSFSECITIEKNTLKT